MHLAMMKDKIVDLGDHEGEVIIRDNLGECSPGGELWYPYFKNDN